jgi:hypothetical protein
MSNKRITDLTELTTPTTDDVFPIVDIATNTTQKVQVGNLPIQTAVTTALATKQDTLVSGTNIKTLNSTSLLGSGNIVLTANPSGVAGAIQFSNGSAFASDAANLFWDDTNNRLGVGTNAPTSPLDVNGTIKTNSDIYIQGNDKYLYANNGGGSVTCGLNLRPTLSLLDVVINGGRAVTFGPSTRTTIVGSGSTSATTSLLVQNSAGNTAMEVKDNLTVGMGGAFVNSNAGAYTTVASFSANYAGILFNSTAGSASKAGIGLDSAKMFFGEETNGSTLYGYRAMIDLRNGCFVVKNDTAAGVNASLNASAALQADSTTRGFLPPRMTTTQRDAITSPATGLKIYNTTLGTTDTYDGATWQRFGQQTLIKGSGSTSATTSLLVQNSAGTAALRVTDDRIVKTFNGLDLSGNYLYANGVGNASIFGGTSLLFDTTLSGSFRFRTGSMAVGASVADATAHLDVQSTTKGFLPPRMTTTQKNAISSPAAGLVVYDNTTNKLCCYDGSTWNDLF